jgi:hypothetical protein
MKMRSTIVIIMLLLSSIAEFRAQQKAQTDAECGIITTTDLADLKAPAFDAYPSTVFKTISTPRLDVTSNPVAKEYRTVLRREISKGPNFADHYRVVVWGCGSSCAMFAVVNLKTGRVITPTGFSVVSGVHLATDDFLPRAESDSWGFRYRKDSKLLVVLGALDEDDAREGAFYFFD